MAHRIRLEPVADHPLAADFRRLRERHRVPAEFPPEVLAAAERAARDGPADLGPRTDLRALPFFTVDPPGSFDLDQAMLLEPRDDGHRVHYAIADVAAFVPADGAVAAEAWARGETLYLPDGRVPLYPTSLSEGAASLLPGQDRPAIVFTIDLDASGEATATTVQRALVRSHDRLDYTQIRGQRRELLRAIATARMAVAHRNGAVRLDSPGQQVVADAAAPCGYRIELEQRRAAEDWNAEISLLAGAEAARLMLAGGVGLLRTMAPPDPYRVQVLRRSAAALGVPWPAATGFADFAGGLHPGDARDAVLIDEARAASGRAGYTAFDGAPPAIATHAALGTPYAHTTAPLRRLGDRHVLDLLVDLAGGGQPGAQQRQALTRLPAVMDAAEAHAGQIDRAAVDLVEARLLEHLVGREFAAIAVDQDAHGTRIQLADPPVRARLHGDPGPPLGTSIRVRLISVDPLAPALRFQLA